MGSLESLGDILKLLVELVEDKVPDLRQNVSIDVSTAGIIYVKL
jgi:hypothetical protein